MKKTSNENTNIMRDKRDVLARKKKLNTGCQQVEYNQKPDNQKNPVEKKLQFLQGPGTIRNGYVEGASFFTQADDSKFVKGMWTYGAIVSYDGKTTPVLIKKKDEDPNWKLDPDSYSLGETLMIAGSKDKWKKFIPQGNQLFLVYDQEYLAQLGLTLSDYTADCSTLAITDDSDKTPSRVRSIINPGLQGNDLLKSAALNIGNSMENGIPGLISFDSLTNSTIYGKKNCYATLGDGADSYDQKAINAGNPSQSEKYKGVFTNCPCGKSYHQSNQYSASGQHIHAAHISADAIFAGYSAANVFYGFSQSQCGSLDYSAYSGIPYSTGTHPYIVDFMYYPKSSTYNRSGGMDDKYQWICKIPVEQSQTLGSAPQNPTGTIWIGDIPKTEPPPPPEPPIIVNPPPDRPEEPAPPAWDDEPIWIKKISNGAPIVDEPPANPPLETPPDENPIEPPLLPPVDYAVKSDSVPMTIYQDNSNILTSQVQYEKYAAKNPPPIVQGSSVVTSGVRPCKLTETQMPSLHLSAYSSQLKNDLTNGSNITYNGSLGSDELTDPYLEYREDAENPIMENGTIKTQIPASSGTIDKYDLKKRTNGMQECQTTKGLSHEHNMTAVITGFSEQSADGTLLSKYVNGINQKVASGKGGIVIHPPDATRQNWDGTETNEIDVCFTDRANLVFGKPDAYSAIISTYQSTGFKYLKIDLQSMIKLLISNMPIDPAGLEPGAIWSDPADGNTLKMVV